jgi:hypothetical protein
MGQRGGGLFVAKAERNGAVNCRPHVISLGPRFDCRDRCDSALPHHPKVLDVFAEITAMNQERNAELAHLTFDASSIAGDAYCSANNVEVEDLADAPIDVFVDVHLNEYRAVYWLEDINYGSVADCSTGSFFSRAGKIAGRVERLLTQACQTINRRLTTRNNWLIDNAGKQNNAMCALQPDVGNVWCNDTCGHFGYLEILPGATDRYGHDRQRNPYQRHYATTPVSP